MAKKIVNYLLSMLLAFTMMIPVSVKAANLTITPDAYEVEVGDTVTYVVEVTDGYGTVNVDGEDISFDSKAVGKKTFTRSYSAEGDFRFEVSGILEDYSTGEQKEYLDFIIVKVVAQGTLENQTPSTDNNTQTEENTTGDDETNDEEEKSGEVRLSSLTVKDTDGDNISIDFSSETTEYDIDLTSEDTQVTIKAEPWDEKATVEGTGLKSLKEGKNTFEIIVTAEDGTTQQTYTINVNVEVVPVTYLTYNGQKYGLMEELLYVNAPEGFNKSTATINKENVTIFKNGSLILVYGLDENDNGEFFIYKEDDGIIGNYNPLTIGKTTVYLVDIPINSRSREGMSLETITIAGKEVEAWVFDDSQLIDYALIYALDKNGIEDYFVYDGKTQQLLEYPDTNPVTYEDFQKWLDEEEKEKPNYVLYGSIAAVVIAVVGVVIWMMKKGDDEDEEEEDIQEVTPVIKKQTPEVKVDVQKKDLQKEETKHTTIESSEDDDWLSDDFYKTIMGDKE